MVQAGLCVLDFIRPHGGENIAATRIGFRQEIEMLTQMGLNLTLGFHQESHAPAIPEQTGYSSKRERTRIKERRKPTCASAQFTQALSTPGQVISLLARRLLQQLACFCRTRDHRLALIEGLRANLSSMVHAHQRDRSLAVNLRYRALLTGVDRIECNNTLRMHWREHSAQSCIHFANQSINKIHMPTIKEIGHRFRCPINLLVTANLLRTGDGYRS